MRAVVVSAHYPPDFVSGGTLQPQRIARRLRERGHDVVVYAGHLGGGEPLYAWDDHDETGLPVRWINVGPFTRWDDDRNWDNPGVTEDFAAFAEGVRPDVVHFHSLQSLGAGVVAAVAGRVRTVVTMHDFWWVCGRQFLVEPRLEPCSLVADAGECPCAVDAAWRARRSAHLRRVLDGVDVVLTPSRSAAAVLAANGVAPDRIQVDENGVPDEERPATGATPLPPAPPVRFVYAGGPDPLKGVGVLLDAVQRLDGIGGWQLDAYGAASFARDRGLVLDRLPVRLLEPFAPTERAAALGAGHVLVLPSVMRESHSLLTREALLLGRPVVCTDTLGPEEVVRDGVNGLVVPAADPAALAGALARLVREPDLLPRLATGCAASPPEVRSLDDQVDALERHYTPPAPAPAPAPAPESVAVAVAAAPAAPNAGPWPRRVLFVAGADGAPGRYRVHLPAEALRLLGIAVDVAHYRDPELRELAATSDVVCIHRARATPFLLDVVAAAQHRDIPVVFDADDLVFDPELAAEIPALQLLDAAEAAHWMEGVHRYRTTLEHCDGFIGSTAPIVAHQDAVVGKPSAQFDNGVGLVVGRLSDRALRRPRRRGPPRIGWFSGTITHDLDWFQIEDAVMDALARHPAAELWLVGHVPASAALDRLGGRLRRQPFVDWRLLPDLLRDVDVNLAPLTPLSRFNDAKSAIKWLEAALTATPTVASPTPAFADAVEHDRNGMLAASTDDWAASLDRLLGDEARRRRLGERARRDALLRWSPHLQARRYAAILGTARAWRAAPGGASGAWAPVVVDEPLGAAPLEPYTLAPPPRRTAPRRLWSSLAEHGVVGTARRVRDRLRRREAEARRTVG